MKNRFLVLAGLLWLSAGALEAGEVPSIADAIENVRRRQQVVIVGTVKRAINFDQFILTDGSTDVLINAAGVRHRLAAKSRAVIRGRYMGHSDRQPNFREIEVMEVAEAGSPEAERLLARYRKVPAAPTPVPSDSGAAAPAKGPRTPESRLRDLENLRNNGLITDDEYHSARKRILDDL